MTPPRAAFLASVLLLAALPARAQDSVDPQVKAAVARAFARGEPVRAAVPPGAALDARFSQGLSAAENVQAGGGDGQDDEGFRRAALAAADALGVSDPQERDALVALYRKRRAAGMRAGGAAGGPDDRAALARVNALKGRVAVTKNPFASRDPGALGGAPGPGPDGRTPPAPAPSSVNAAIAAARAAPAAQAPQDFRARAAAVPDPPAPGGEEPGKTACDKSRNGFLQTIFNLESCSNAGTRNRESLEGTKSRICQLLKKTNYDPSAAWGLAVAERGKPGADPGDLDLRDAEHYLYAYSSVKDGDSVVVQEIMAVGWTPFKTLTKYVRPTSTPSLDEMEWGMRGAYHGKSEPNWRKRCAAAPAAVSI